MASSFSFGFSGDDIEQEEGGEQRTEIEIASNTPVQQACQLKPQNHLLADLMGTLPSKIAYSGLLIESPSGRKLVLPRRELFDIKMQLMAEDDAESGGSISGLDTTDIRTNIYEGGFKTWECSLDLAKLLLDRGPRKDLDELCRVHHVVELGCGTSVPSLILFRHAVIESLAMYFTLADYNETVLRLVTLPNLLLTWVSTLQESEAPFDLRNSNPVIAGNDGDLEITPTLKAAFVNAMNSSGLLLNFVSGSWSPSAAFLSFIPTAPEMNILVLASETIYSPDALPRFTAALIGILRQVRVGKAIVAAKRVYFGVGGSVDAFKIACRERGAVACEVENHGLDLGESCGVRRCLVEVQML